MSAFCCEGGLASPYQSWVPAKKILQVVPVTTRAGSSPLLHCIERSDDDNPYPYSRPWQQMYEETACAAQETSSSSFSNDHSSSANWPHSLSANALFSLKRVAMSVVTESLPVNSEIAIALVDVHPAQRTLCTTVVHGHCVPMVEVFFSVPFAPTHHTINLIILVLHGLFKCSQKNNSPRSECGQCITQTARFIFMLLVLFCSMFISVCIFIHMFVFLSLSLLEGSGRGPRASPQGSPVNPLRNGLPG